MTQCCNLIVVSMSETAERRIARDRSLWW